MRIKGSADEVIAEMVRRLDLADLDVREASLAFALLRVARRDARLLKRVGTSMETAGFLAIRDALSRDCISALMRIVDGTNDKNLRLEDLVEPLRRLEVVSAIAKRRADAFADEQERAAQHAAQARKQIAAVLALYDQFAKRDGARDPVVKALMQLRHDRIAHRRVIARSTEAINHQPRRAKVGDERRVLIWAMNILERLRRLADDLAVYYAEQRETDRRIAQRFWARIGPDPFAQRRRRKSKAAE